MNNVERAAVILLGMDKDQASQVLKHLNTSDIEKLARAMQRVSKSDESDINETINEFLQMSDNSNVLRASIKNSVDVQPTSSQQPPSIELGVLLSQSTENIFDFVKEEHPQVIAVIIGYLDSDKAAELLNMLDDHARVDVIKRLAKIDTISPVAVQMITEMMEAKINSLKKHTEVTFGGPKSAAAIITHLDGATENKVLHELSAVDEKLGAEVQDMIFAFENLSTLSDKDLKVLLRTVEDDTLCLAIKAADEQVKSALFKNMAKQTVAAIKERLTENHPNHLSDIIYAQKKILSEVHRLSSAGEITMSEV